MNTYLPCAEKESGIRNAIAGSCQGKDFKTRSLVTLKAMQELAHFLEGHIKGYAMCQLPFWFNIQSLQVVLLTGEYQMLSNPVSDTVKTSNG